MPKLRVQQLNQPESHVNVVNVGREESEQWTGNRRFIFLPPRLMLRTHFALRARYRVRLAWLINRLFCRLETDNKISNALGVTFEATNIYRDELFKTVTFFLNVKSSQFGQRNMYKEIQLA